MKVFISQPMRDKTNEQIKEEREKAIQDIYTCVNLCDGEDVEILDTFFENAPHEAPPLWFLEKNIQYLGKADLAYFCKGWENYRGCRCEHNIANEYEIHTIEVERQRNSEGTADIEMINHG
jgi:hypothetical protein